jgi:hypothetical protein
MAADQAPRQAAASAALAAREDAVADAAAAARGALVCGAGGSCVRLTTGFGVSMPIFFGFGFGFGGLIKTTAGFDSGGSSRTAIVCGGSAFSGSACVICGPRVGSGGTSDGGALSTGASSIIITAGGVPADPGSRMNISQNAIPAWTAATVAAANIHRHSARSSSAGSIVAMVIA